jgi:hypothetical protein
MKWRLLDLPLLLVLTILLSACAATPTVHEDKPRTADLSRYATLQVVVDAPDAIVKQTGYDLTSAALLKEFIEDARALGKYSAVGTEAAGSKVLEAKLTITELNYVHGAARGSVGILAGRAVLNVTMTLRDKGTGAVLGVVNAAHSSSHLQGVFSPTTSRQVTAIAKELSSKL